jgi:hypothetical protein
MKALCRTKLHRMLVACALVVVAGAASPTEHSGDELRGNTGIEHLPPKPATSWWPLWVGVGLLGVTAAGLMAWRHGRRLLTAPEVPPYAWALKELDAIADRPLPEATAAERYHTLVSNIIRQYLEMRFQLHAPRQTTEEFLHAMRQSPKLSPEQQTLLEAFLQRCDLAKFARAGYSAAECQDTLTMARQFVQQTAPGTNWVP